MVHHRVLQPTIEAGDEFTCAVCGQLFEAICTHATAMADFKRNFPAEARAADPRDVICDRCFNQVTESIQGVQR